MAHNVQCRLCKIKFDTEHNEYILVGQKSYYHKECYDQWIKSRNLTCTNRDEDFWKESVIDYLYRDVKISIDFAKLENQWNNFIKPERKMTPKGIYFALKYYYDVIHGDKIKALGGIGIVPSIYGAAAEYWINLEQRKAGTIDAIIEQIKERQARPVQHITPKKETKKKAKFNLDEV